MLFRNRRKTANKDQHEAQDKIARHIAGQVIRYQSAWASWMQKQSERLSVKTKAILLAIFFLLAGGYCGYLIFSSSNGSGFNISSISQPASVKEDGARKETGRADGQHQTIYDARKQP